MSHLPLRKNTTCLNCGSIVSDRFCAHCGQENIEPKESVWHFVTHFINDVTHFDGNFFTTLKYLLFKPGFLSREYVMGKRVRYLNPVRMYLFTSFIFFLVFFSFYHLDDNGLNSAFVFNGKTEAQVNAMTPGEFADFAKNIDKVKIITKEDYHHYFDSLKNSSTDIHFSNQHYKSKEQYDSLMNLEVKKPNWLQRKLVYREIEMDQKYGNDNRKVLLEVISTLIHSFPQMLFVSLPFVALILQLLYIRQKQNYFVSHSIFVIHLYIFIFIVLLLLMGIGGLRSILPGIVYNWLIGLIFITVLFYLYKAMRKFYAQSRRKTLLKYFLFLFVFFLLMALLLMVFFILSVFKA